MEKDNTVNFDNAVRLKRLGYNTSSPKFYDKFGDVMQSYAIDISSELLWYVPSADQVFEFLKTTYHIVWWLTPSMWDVDDLIKGRKTNVCWFFRSSADTGVVDGTDYNKVLNDGISRILDYIEKNNVQ